MRIEFAKMHGLGNDFVVIDGISQALPPDLTTPPAIRKIADRQRGIGCDQLLLLQPASATTADFFYRIFNADGSQVGQCGNGARCAHLFLRQRRLTSKSELYLQTTTTQIRTTVVDESTVRATIPPPVFSEPIKLAGHSLQRLDIGNPHAVCLNGGVNEKILQQMGEQLNHQFADGVNVAFGTVRTTDIILQVYERGVGLTQACGSGALAAAVVAISSGLSANPVMVTMKGGGLLCGVNDDASIWLEGGVSAVFDGTFLWREGHLQGGR